MTAVAARAVRALNHTEGRLAERGAEESTVMVAVAKVAGKHDGGTKPGGQSQYAMVMTAASQSTSKLT